MKQKYEIKLFKKEHLEDAAKLFVSRYKGEKIYNSILPSRYENYKVIIPLLDDLIQKVPGVVVIRDKKISGYLIGQLLSLWRGRRSVFVPFWAHSAEEENRKKIYQKMYAHLSYEWVTNGSFTHLISVLAYDKEAIDTLFWFGFGMAVIDTMRDLSDVRAPITNIEIRRAGLSDLDVVVSLHHELQRYLAGPPIFMAMIEKRSKEYHEKWLSNCSNALWLASYKGEVVSFMKICPLNEDYLITDEKTAWIQGAYTKEHLRGKGIGTVLLKKSLEWVQSQGYERCAVDFEGENILARSFWLKYFTPICFSLVRQVDKRIAWAHKDRKDEHFW